MNILSNTSKNLIANYFGQFWTAVMGVAFLPLYIKYLGIDSYGLIGFFSALFACLMLMDLGLTSALSREMARFTGGLYSPQEIRNLLRSVEIVVVFLAFLIYIIGFLFSDLLANEWINSTNLTADIVSKAISVMSLVASLRFLEGIYKSCIAGLQEHIKLNIALSIIATLRWFGAVLVIYWISPTITAFFYWQAFVSLLSIVLLGLITYNIIPSVNVRPFFSWASLSKIFSFAAGVMGISILSLLLTQGDKLLLSRLLNLGDYGYYMLAATVSGGLFALITPVAQSYYPRMCELLEREDYKNLTDSFHMGAQLVSVTAGSVALILILFSGDILFLWSNDVTLSAQSARLLSILTFGNLLNGLLWIPYQAQLAFGWTKLTIRTNIIALLFLFPLLLYITPRFGVTGAAWVWVILNVGYITISVHFMFRKILFKEKLKWYINDILMPLIPSSIIVLCLKFLIIFPTEFWMQIFYITGFFILALVVSTFCSDKLRKFVFYFH